MSEIIKRIHYHDTDCGQVVYYANYLKYFEEARAEHLRECGIDLLAWAQKGYQFAVRRAEVDYRFPARYNDLIRVVSTISDIRNASLTFNQEVFIGSQLAVSGRIVLVCVNSDFKATSLPLELKQFLKP